MEAAVVAGLIGSGVVVFGNVSLFIYGYGRLSQKVDDARSALDKHADDATTWRDDNALWMTDHERRIARLEGSRAVDSQGDG